MQPNNLLMIEIEFEKPNIYNCDCCGNEIHKLTRFVYSNDNAHAVYFLQFSKGHNDDSILGILSLGEWGDGCNPKNRKAFPFRIWTKEENYQVGLMDKNECPWDDVELLGEILNREQSLKHEWIKEVFHITDHILADDKEAIEFLN